MKFGKILISILCGGAVISSCVKPEALNQECDIRKAVIHLPHPEAYFTDLNDTMVTILPSLAETTIQFQGVKDGVNLKGLAPEFTISAGAALFPPQGTLRDFSNPDDTVAVFVIAEDTKDRYPFPTHPKDFEDFGRMLKDASDRDEHVRPYKVEFVQALIEVADTIKYSFDNYKLEDRKQKYYDWSDPFKGRERSIPNWATANIGYSTAKSSAAPMEYPTVPAASGGVDGKAYAVLQTKDTGDWGTMFKMPLAAGNLFLGTFDMSCALQNALRATRFGDRSVLGRKPVRFSGYYKYTPGPQMQDPQGKPIDGIDMPDIYCVVYRNKDVNGKPIVLFGDDVNTSQYIVGRAKLGEAPNAEDDGRGGVVGQQSRIYSGTPDWVRFSLDFLWFHELDPDLLRNHGYNFAIVCSASKDGASYQGAIGSTLCVDNFTIINE